MTIGQMLDRIMRRRQKLPLLPPLDAEYHYKAITVPVVYLPLDTATLDQVPTNDTNDVVDLIAGKMAEASRSMDEMLTKALWPRPRWYVRAWDRIRDTWLVAIGRRYAVDSATAFHVCDVQEIEEES